MKSSALPRNIADHQDLERLHAAADRTETRCGDGKIVWRVWGKTGRAVVLLHGGSGSWRHWIRNIDELVSRGYRVYVPDLPGFGDSSLPPVGFDADAHTEWILLGLEELLGPVSCDIVGFSFGAMVAAFVAVQGPSRVDRLILVGAPALMESPARRVIIKNWRAPEFRGKEREAHRHNLRALMLTREESASDFAIDLYGADAERDRIPQRRLFRTDILRRQMPLVQCPVWGIWGNDDALLEGNLDAIEAGMAGAPFFKGLTLIPDAGHWVQFESAERFNRTLYSLLDSGIEGKAHKP